MARTDNLSNFLTDVADAIRTKKGTSETINASDFDTEIENLPSGGEQNVEFDNGILLTASSFYKAITKVKNIDTSQKTSGNNLFAYFDNLEEVGPFDTSKMTNISYMFADCKKLKTIPQFDFGNVSMSNYGAFNNCISLTDESLNNLLISCVGMTKISPKNLKTLGFTSTNYPVERIEALPSYQDFLDAGWTIGY